jgi:two-component system sensor kinase FixL
METSQKRELIIATARCDEDMVSISVADTGSGIAPEITSQLFQPFVSNKRHGMGVGLSISRTIVEAHGGQIGAEPNPGGGTIFRFTLRAVSQEEITDAV